MGAILATLLLQEPKCPLWKDEFGLPLPKVFHVTLTEDDIGDRRVLVVGDVHGCLDELKELLEKADANTQNTTIILCGDIINKGPKHIETLHFVRELNLPVVRGNNEEKVINEWYKLQKAGDGYLLRKKLSWIRDLTQDDINYLQDLPYTISIPHLQSIIVHAGLYPWKPLKLQQPIDMTLMRDIVDADGPNPQAAERTHRSLPCLPWASQWMGPEHVYFGHDARRKLQRYSFATGLDTACVRGGCLTGVFLTGEKQFVSVQSKQV